MSSSRSPILERVEQDLARGDLALARVRLVDHLSAVGYRADLMARVARIAARMGDPFDAGRFWLLSEDDDPQAAPAIAEFVRRAGGKPESICGALPGFTRRIPLDHYPPAVRRRLDEMGLSECIERRTCPGAPASRSWERLAGAAALLVLVLLVVCAVIGLGTVGSWLTS